MDNTLPLFPARDEAEALLTWAEALNPGPWAAHSRTVARAAKTIAAHCSLYPEKAYVLGLLHDIGRYEGVRGLHHVYAGYELLMKKHYDEAARICLTHSFPVRNICFFSGEVDCTAEEIAVIKKAIEQGEFTEYDRLIQRCDALGMAGGVTIIDVRLMEVARRHGVNADTPRKWDAFFALKGDFDRKCGINIYSLFNDEICHSIFGYPGL